MADTVLKCACGSFEAVLSGVSKHEGTHARCHCDDCRAAGRVMSPGAEYPDGVALFQTSPDKLTIRKGADHLACFTLSPKGLLRWYADCCNTPMFNTLRSAKLPFVGVLADQAEDKTLFGPVRARGFIKTPDGKVQHKGIWLMVSRMFRRIVASRLSGRWTTTPFFDTATNTPTRAPRLITKDEKAKAYAR